MANGMKQVMEKLDDIKLELDYIKGHIIDGDVIMSDDDLQSLRQAEKEFKEGKTTPHAKLKKGLDSNVPP